MDRINGAGHVNRRFVTEDAGQNRPPTEITDLWLNSVQEEIANVIIASGAVLNPILENQLLTAINSLITAGVPSISDASEVLSGKVELATTAETLTGTDTTRAVHPAGVRAAISALVNASPAALDTLKELATALGNDANFATTMTNALAGKAPSSHTHDYATHRGEGTNYIDYAAALYDSYRGGWRNSNDLKVAYAVSADSAGNADTLDGYHAASFAQAGHGHDYSGSFISKDMGANYPIGCIILGQQTTLNIAPGGTCAGANIRIWYVDNNYAPGTWRNVSNFTCTNFGTWQRVA